MSDARTGGQTEHLQSQHLYQGDHDHSASNTTKSSTQSALGAGYQRPSTASAAHNKRGGGAWTAQRVRSATLPEAPTRQGSHSHSNSSENKTVQQAVRPTLDSGPPSRGSYIHMNDSNLSQAESLSRTISPAGKHARQESGYQSSTIGTSSLPPMTIGVKRGSDLLASRRGPQITGQAATQPLKQAAGSAPPMTSTVSPQHLQQQAQANRSLQDFFDADPRDQHIARMLMGSDSNLPDRLADQRRGQQHPRGGGSRMVDDDEEEDDGIEPADDFLEDDTSQIDNYGKLLPAEMAKISSMPIDADPIRSVLSPTSQFYQLQQNRNDGQNSASGHRSHALSSDALAAHNEAMRSYQPTQTDVGLVPPRATKISSGTLGSPFNELQPGAAGIQPASGSTPVISRVPSGVGRVVPPGQKSSKDRKTSGMSRSDKPKNDPRAQSNAKQQADSKHAFPSRGRDEGNTSSASLPAAASNRTANGSGKKPPPSSGLASRTRKSSSASDHSMKKDDLLDRLASALKAERKLVGMYGEELQKAEEEMNKMLDAERDRDAEMQRLEARHIRDKQIISALKLKVERQAMELARAEDVPEHEAEVYLDLLSGRAGSGLAEAGSRSRRSTHGVRGLDGVHDLDIEDAQSESGESDNDMDQERSMKDLVAEEDALNGAWTQATVEREKQRRKEFAKKRKQHAAEFAAENSRVGSSSNEPTEAQLAEAQAMALAKAGLDQPVRPAQNHTRKLSFKDSLRRTFGRKNSNADKMSVVRIVAPPDPPVVQLDPPSQVSFAPATSVQMVRSTSAPPPTIQLPPIPIDPKLNAKDAKAQQKRLAKLEAEQSNTLGTAGGLTAPSGTYGRSASMDVPSRQSMYIPADMSNPMLPASGYSSDSEVAPTSKSGLFGSRSARPPVSGVGRYGGGIAGGRERKERVRKLSFPSLKLGTSGGGSGTGTGTGFFKQLFPGLDNDVATSRPSRIAAGHAMTPNTASSNGLGFDIWRRGGKREEKTWSQQLPAETTVIHG